MKDFLYVVCGNDEHIIYVSPNYTDCLDFAREYYKNTTETPEIQLYNYNAILDDYLNYN